MTCCASLLFSIKETYFTIMQYTEATFIIRPMTETNAEILKALAAEGGFESFTDTKDGFKAYIQTKDFQKENVENALHELPLTFDFDYQFQDAEDKDWNETWESEGFTPVTLGPEKEITIRDTHHQPLFPPVYDILINPRQAFGTGGHETTGMLLETLLEMDLKQKKVLDMGCGTGILGIFTALKGAKKVTGIDIDEWSVRNAQENVRLNKVEQAVHIELGDAKTLENAEKDYDVLIANINRNILLRDLPSYSSVLKATDATLLLSGFYEEDAPLLKGKAEEYGFRLTNKKTNNRWCVLRFQR